MKNWFSQSTTATSTDNISIKFYIRLEIVMALLCRRFSQRHSHRRGFGCVHVRIVCIQNHFHSHATSIEMDRSFNRHVAVVQRREHIPFESNSFLSLFFSFVWWTHVADKRHAIEMDVAANSMHIVAIWAHEQMTTKKKEKKCSEMFFQYKSTARVLKIAFLFVMQARPNYCRWLCASNLFRPRLVAVVAVFHFSRLIVREPN